MDKKYLLWTSVVFAAFLLISSVSTAKATVHPAGIPNQNEIIIMSIGIPETVDPAWEYDTSSAELTMQIYDTLIDFDWEDPASFIPSLATRYYVQATPNPGYEMTLVFEMRGDIKWHDGTVSSDTDMASYAEYTFERWIFFDRSGGPNWMFMEMLYGPGTYSVWDLGATPGDIAAVVDATFESSGNLFWLNMQTEALQITLQIVAQPWASIIHPDWAAAQGAWDGDYANWAAFNDPAISPFDDPEPVTMGTGPYMGPPVPGTYVDYIIEKWRIVRFADYWGGWSSAADRGSSGYVDAVKEITEYSFATRLSWFLSDDPAAQADLITIPRANIYHPDLIAALRNGRARVIGNPREEGGLPVLSIASGHMNFKISSLSTYIGDGSQNWGTSIPLTFFADADIRKAFANSFDWATYIATVVLGEGEQAATPMLKGLGFDDLYDAMNEALKYSFDRDKARAHLQAAHGGAAWENGFEFSILFNTGNTARQTAAQMLETNIEYFNTERVGKPEFKITVSGIPWSVYLREMVRKNLPMWFIGWLADYPDAHNFFFPYMHTYGDFSYFQSYSNAHVDELIEAEIMEPERAERMRIFGDLMAIFADEIPTLMLVQATGRHYERSWVQGWYYNTIAPGNDYYRMWKGLDGDIAGSVDNKVTVVDGAWISAHWTQPVAGKPLEIGPLGYDRSADIGLVIDPEWLTHAERFIRADEGLQYSVGPEIEWYLPDGRRVDAGTPGSIPVAKLGFADIFDAGMVKKYFGDTL